MSARQRGGAKLAGSGLAFAGVFYAVLQHKSLGSSHAGPIALIAMGAPGAFALVGLFELVSGMPFTKAAEAWDSLEGWQRGVLGLMVVVLAFALVIGGMVLYATLTG